VKEYTSCQEAAEACIGEEDGSAGGGDDGDDGDDGGDGGDATGNWGDYDEDEGSDDTKGCTCHLAGVGPWAAPLVLVPLLGLLRRRRR